MTTHKKKRILIANRGEIATRIAKAIKELNHTSVGIWTARVRLHRAGHPRRASA